MAVALDRFLNFAVDRGDRIASMGAPVSSTPQTASA